MTLTCFKSTLNYQEQTFSNNKMENNWRRHTQQQSLAHMYTNTYVYSYTHMHEHKHIHTRLFLTASFFWPQWVCISHAPAGRRDEWASRKGHVQISCVLCRSRGECPLENMWVMVFGMRSGINDSSSQSQNSRAQSVGSSFPRQGCQMRLDPFDKNHKENKNKTLGDKDVWWRVRKRSPERANVRPLCSGY